GRGQRSEHDVLAFVMHGGGAVLRLYRELIDEAVRVVLHGDAGVGRVQVPGSGSFLELLHAEVHQVERDADGDGGHGNADEEGEALLDGGGADEVAGLEVLGRVSGFSRGDADHATDGDGEGSKGGRGPAAYQEDGGGGHQGGDSHAGDGVGGAADEAHDPRADRDEQEAEENDEDGGADVGEHAGLGAGNGLKPEEEE